MNTFENLRNVWGVSRGCLEVSHGKGIALKTDMPLMGSRTHPRIPGGVVEVGSRGSSLGNTRVLYF